MGCGDSGDPAVKLMYGGGDFLDGFGVVVAAFIAADGVRFASEGVDNIPEFFAGYIKPSLQNMAFDCFAFAAVPPFQAVQECFSLHIRLLSPVSGQQKSHLWRR